jgi:hypothetical protein
VFPKPPIPPTQTLHVWTFGFGATVYSSIDAHLNVPDPQVCLPYPAGSVTIDPPSDTNFRLSESEEFIVGGDSWSSQLEQRIWQRTSRKRRSRKPREDVLVTKLPELRLTQRSHRFFSSNGKDYQAREAVDGLLAE